jgi:hypothetical protein
MRMTSYRGLLIFQTLLLVSSLQLLDSFATTYRLKPISYHVTKVQDHRQPSSLHQLAYDESLALSHNETSILKRKIDNDFLHVSLPAFFSLAAEPLVTLVDSAYVGQLGAVEQAGKQSSPLASIIAV